MTAVRKPTIKWAPLPILLIAGGRDYTLQREQRVWLDGIHAAMRFALVIHGGAPGADTGGGAWARSRNIQVKVFEAKWDKHGKAAGPMRNEAMAHYVAAMAPFPHQHCVVLFPGGRGTTNMHARADEMNLRIIFYTPAHEPPDGV